MAFSPDEPLIHWKNHVATPPVPRINQRPLNEGALHIWISIWVETFHTSTEAWSVARDGGSFNPTTSEGIGGWCPLRLGGQKAGRQTGSGARTIDKLRQLILVLSPPSLLRSSRARKKESNRECHPFDWLHVGKWEEWGWWGTAWCPLRLVETGMWTTFAL